MTDLQLADYLKTFLTLSTPADTGTLTISSISGNTLQLSASPTGATDAWVGGVIEITSGVAINTRNIIIASSGPVITVATSWNKEKKPQVGDTCVLTGGPLKSARIFVFEPDSIDQDINDGKNFFVIINCIGGVLDLKGFGGRSTKGAASSQRLYHFEVSCETPDLTGVGTEADAKRIAYDLPTFKEQVIVLTHWFRLQTSNNLTGSGDIEFAYASYQRTGSNRRLRGAIIEFDCRIN